MATSASPSTERAQCIPMMTHASPRTLGLMKGRLQENKSQKHRDGGRCLNLLQRSWTKGAESLTSFLKTERRASAALT